MAEVAGLRSLLPEAVAWPAKVAGPDADQGRAATCLVVCKAWVLLPVARGGSACADTGSADFMTAPLKSWLWGSVGRILGSGFDAGQGHVGLLQARSQDPVSHMDVSLSASPLPFHSLKTDGKIPSGED